MGGDNMGCLNDNEWESQIVEWLCGKYKEQSLSAPKMQMAAAEKPSFEAAKAIEESVQSTLTGKSDLWKAIAYKQINAEGMSLEKAKSLKRKAGLTE